MSKTRIEEMNNEESFLINNEATDYVKPVKAKLKGKAKIELSKRDKSIIDWYKRGQSIEWLTTAFMLPANQIKKIVDNADV